MRSKLPALIRASQLQPFMNEYEAAGKNPIKLLRQCYCPLGANLGNPECIVMTSKFWQFVERASSNLRDSNFGWNTAINRGLEGAGTFGYLCENQASLHDAMNFYSKYLPNYASVSKGLVVEDGDSL